MSTLLGFLAELCGKCFYYFLKFIKDQKTEVIDLEDNTKVDWDDLKDITDTGNESASK
jgi:hypothetical protein